MPVRSNTRATLEHVFEQFKTRSEQVFDNISDTNREFFPALPGSGPMASGGCHTTVERSRSAL
jgi:hypothetical protein